MKEVTVTELKEMLDEGQDIQLIDVREKNEYDLADIGGELIPLGTVPDQVDKISRDKKVIIHCRSGKRSASAIEFLEQKHGFTNLYNLRGGYLAWVEEIDDTLPRY